MTVTYVHILQNFHTFYVSICSRAVYGLCVYRKVNIRNKWTNWLLNDRLYSWSVLVSLNGPKCIHHIYCNWINKKKIMITKKITTVVRNFYNEKRLEQNSCLLTWTTFVLRLITIICKIVHITSYSLSLYTHSFTLIASPFCTWGCKLETMVLECCMMILYILDTQK